MCVREEGFASFCLEVFVSVFVSVFVWWVGVLVRLRCSERRRIFVLCEYLRVFECVSLDEK